MSDSISNDVTLPQIKLKKSLYKFNKLSKMNTETDRQVYSHMGFKSAFENRKSSLRMSNGSNGSYYNNFSQRRSILSSGSGQKLGTIDHMMSNPYLDKQLATLGTQDHYKNFYRNSSTGATKNTMRNVRKISQDLDQSPIQPIPINNLTKITLADLNKISESNR